MIEDLWYKNRAEQLGLRVIPPTTAGPTTAAGTTSRSTPTVTAGSARAVFTASRDRCEAVDGAVDLEDAKAAAMIERANRHDPALAFAAEAA